MKNSTILVALLVAFLFAAGGTLAYFLTNKEKIERSPVEVNVVKSDENQTKQTPQEEVTTVVEKKVVLVEMQVSDKDGYTNVRKGPGTGYDIVDQVLHGSIILVNKNDLGKSWARVYNDAHQIVGYMSTTRLVRVY